MEKVLYLDDNQSEILAFKILELKENKYFRDSFADEFMKLYSEHLARSVTANETLQKLFPNNFKIKISANKLSYLMRLTETDIFDPNVINSHIEYKEKLGEKLETVRKK